MRLRQLDMLNLKQALKDNKLSRFIEERIHLKTDSTKFNDTLNSMASGKNSKAHPASSQERDGD